MRLTLTRWAWRLTPPAILAAAAMVWGLAPTATPPAAKPSAITGPVPTSMPATAPAKYPSEKLIAACKQAEQALRKRLSSEFVVQAQEPFIVAGAMPERQLKQYITGSVVRPAKAMWASYFAEKPDKPITVLLFANGTEYRTWAGKLFKDRDLPHFGYYRPTDRTLVMNIATGTGTLVHELTHALIVYDFPAVPTWFNEGLASLHEQCRIAPDKITGLTNWRLPALQQAVRKKSLRPLRETVTARDFYGPLRGLNYAQARYFVMYMQKRGLLKKFYAHFRANHMGENADVKAIEHVFGEPIEQVEKACLSWIMTLRFGR